MAKVKRTQSASTRRSTKKQQSHSSDGMMPVIAKNTKVRMVPYTSLSGATKSQLKKADKLIWRSGKVLGFFIVGFLLERPAGGGAVQQTLKVEGIPKGTKKFYPWP